MNKLGVLFQCLEISISYWAVLHHGDASEQTWLLGAEPACPGSVPRASTGPSLAPRNSLCCVAGVCCSLRASLPRPSQGHFYSPWFGPQPVWLPPLDLALTPEKRSVNSKNIFRPWRLVWSLSSGTVSTRQCSCSLTGMWQWWTRFPGLSVGLRAWQRHHGQRELARLLIHLSPPRSLAVDEAPGKPPLSSLSPQAGSRCPWCPGLLGPRLAQQSARARALVPEQLAHM